MDNEIDEGLIDDEADMELGDGVKVDNEVSVIERKEEPTEAVVVDDILGDRMMGVSGTSKIENNPLTP